MKPIRLGLISIGIAAAIALGGCSVSSGINDITAALSSPQATQSAANLRSWGQAVACFVAQGSASAVKLEGLIKAKQAAIDTTGTIYTISAFVCTDLLGGQAGATVPVVAAK